MTGKNRAGRGLKRSTTPFLVRAAASVAAFSALFASSAFADTTATYIGGATGNWSNAANWSNSPAGAFFPNNGNGGANYVVVVDNNPGQNSIVTVDGNFVIDGLTVNPGDVVAIANNISLSLTAGGTILDNGTISLNSVGNATRLILATGIGSSSTVTLTGTGNFLLGDNSNNAIAASAAGLTLDNTATHTIIGAGNIDNGVATAFAMTNEGTIIANSTNNALTVSPRAGMINTGIMEAGNGPVVGVLNLGGTTFNNVGGQIVANAGSIVQIYNGATVTGGTLTSHGNGAIQTVAGDFGATLAGTVTLSAGSQANIVNNSAWLLAGGMTFINNGSVNFNSVGNATDLRLTGGGTVTLGGTGSEILGANSNNHIIANSTGMTLVVATGHTIQGSGVIGEGDGRAFQLINNGLIVANNSAGAMTLSPRGGLINLGVLQAGDGTTPGTLNLDNDTFTNTGSVIRAMTGSLVQLLANTTIVGGTLTTAGTGVIATGGGVFSTFLSGSVTLSTGSTFNVSNNSGLELNDGVVLTNSGIVALQSVGNNTQFVTNSTGGGTVTLAGIGTLTMGDNSNNRIINANSHATFLNLSNIQGAGTIDSGAGNPMTFLNQGTVTAAGGNTLFLSPRAGLTNAGLLQAGAGTASGTLELNSVSLVNAGGTIVANTGSAVALVTSTVTDAVFTTHGTGIIQAGNNDFGTVFVDSVLLTSGSDFILPNNSGITLSTGTTFTNNGTFSMLSANNDTRIILNGSSGTVTLAGSGIYTLSDNTNNRIIATSSGMTLVNNSVIQGAGHIDNGDNTALALINNGTITANSTNNAFVVGPKLGLTNNGLMQAGDGVHPGVLQIDTSPILNTSGTITANIGSALNLTNGLNIVGGVISSVGTGFVQVVSGNFSIQLTGNITLPTGTQFILPNNSGIVLPTGSTLTNNGTFSILSANNDTRIILNGSSGTVTLGGSGIYTLSDNTNNRIIATSSGMTLINNSVIQGAGHIDNGDNTALALINNGTITANSTNNAFIVAPEAGLTNNGLMQAGDGVHPGVLQIDSSPILNTNGTITANVGSNINLANGLNIVGGVLSSIGTGFIQTVSGNFGPELSGSTLTLPTGTQLFIRNNSAVQLASGLTLVNNGTVSLQSANNDTRMDLVGPSGTVTLAGSGLIQWSDNNNNRIIADSSGMTLLNTTNIRAAGAFGGGTAFNLQNQGTITAVGANALTLTVGNGVTNTGLIRAGDGTVTGTIVLQGETFTNTTGTFLANQGSTIVLNNGANLIGGTLVTVGTGSSFQTGSGNFGPTLTGAILIPSTTLVNIVNNSAIVLPAGDVITNNGHIALLSVGNDTRIDLAGTAGGTVTLAGSGSITIGDNSNNRFIADSASLTLLNQSTIEGSSLLGGGLAFSIQNQGSIIAGGAIVLTVNPGGTTSNTGIFRATNGDTLNVLGVFVQDSGGTLTAGTYIADNNSLINLNSPNITDIGALATVILNGSNSQFRQIDNPVNTTGFVTQNDGTFELLGNRSYTVASPFTNAGKLQLGGGTLTATTLTNNSTGTISGFGTIAERPLNHGSIEANGGTLVLVNGINGGSGTIQSDPGSVLDLSGGSAGSNGDFLVNNGSLTLGANNVLVAVNYSNANFGAGNSFNKHANVSATTGLILAGGNNVQTITGNVTGANQANLSLVFGNIHVGDTKSFTYQINNIGTAGPQVLYALQTLANGGNLTDGRLTGSGVTPQNLGPVAFGGSTAPLAVNFSGLTAGSLTAQSFHIANNFDGNASGTASLAEQTLSITGAAYRYAGPVLTGTPINFGNIHVGDTAPVGHFVLSNIDPADGFSESLDATLSGATGGVSVTGGVNLLPAGQTSSADLTAAIASTSNAGSFNGAALLTLISDGTGTSGLGLTSLSTLTLSTNIGVYRYAAPVVANNPVNFGNHHVGDVVLQTIPVSNTDTADGFSEALDGLLAGAGANFTGNFSLLPAGHTASITATLNTASAGNISASATLTLSSDGSGTSNLGVSPRSTVTLTSSGNVYRLATPGTISSTINLGIIHVGATAAATVPISNTDIADNFSEQLGARFLSTSGSVSTLGGPILVNAGASDATSMKITLDTASAGLGRTGSATIHFTSNGAISGLPNTELNLDKTVTLTADVLNFAAASMQKDSGAGNFSVASNSATLDFGTLTAGGGGLSALLAAINTAAAPADTLGGNWSVSSSDPGFTLTGFDAPLGNIAAGSAGSGLGVSFSSATPGPHSEVLVLHPLSQDNAPFSGPLADFTLTIDANVTAPVPEPASLGLLLTLTPMLLRRRRKI